MGLISSVTGALGSIGDALTGHNDFHASQYNVNGNAYVDPNAYANKVKLDALNAQRQGMVTPQAANATSDLANAGQDRGQQQSLIQALQAQAAGQGPSLAQMQMQRGLSQAIAAQHAQAASARGISPGMAQRLASQGSAQLAGQAANDAAMLRMQEQMQAQGQLGGALQGMRGQDIGLAQNNQNFNLANAGLRIQDQGQKDDLMKHFTDAGLGIDAQGFAAQQAGDLAQQNAYNTAMGINSGVAAGNAAGQQNLIGGLLGAGGALGAAAIGKK